MTRSSETSVRVPTVCSPIQKIVFLKTYKTASTTTAAIVERYGYKRDLSFVVGEHNMLSFARPFSREMVLPFPKMASRKFDLLANHARYNRQEMDFLIPNATYITILRKPEDQLESAFGYFEMYKRIQTSGEIDMDALEMFMEDPGFYWRKLRKWQIARNGQLFALGFDHEFDDDEDKILDMIDRLEEEMDLVLISDYYDESLILLRKLLCWDYEDILYVSAGVRSASHRFEKSDQLVDKLRKWNHGDVLLYDHFNRTLWERVSAYGDEFSKDLAHFRSLNRAAFDECIDSHKIDNTDPREDKFVLKHASEKCVALLRADMDYTELIRDSMLAKYGEG